MVGVHGRFRRSIAPRRAILVISGLLAFAFAAPATAQTLPAQAPRAPCELHVWPAATTHTTFQGWVRAGAVDGARRGIKGYPDLDAKALDTEAQARLLATIDWRGDFDDPALVVVVHAAPTGSDDDRTRTSRLVAAGSSPCYRELIISSSIVESEVFSKQSVRILALRKRFDGADAKPVTFSSMSEAAVVVAAPAKGAADPTANMDAALQAAFVSAINRFAVIQSTR